MADPVKRKRGGQKGAKYNTRPRILNNDLRFDLLQTLRAKKFDPAIALIDIHFESLKQYKKRIDSKKSGYGGQGYLGIAASTAKDLCEFVYPKLKTTELTGANGEDLFKSFTGLIKKIADGGGDFETEK